MQSEATYAFPLIKEPIRVLKTAVKFHRDLISEKFTYKVVASISVNKKESNEKNNNNWQQKSTYTLIDPTNIDPTNIDRTNVI